MSLFKKDSIPRRQVKEAWDIGQTAFASFPLGLEVLQAGKDAADALFDTNHDLNFGDAANPSITSRRQQIEEQLHTVLASTVARFRLRAYDLTHDEGRLIDPVAWAVYGRITDRFLPPGGRSRIAKGGPELIDQCLNFSLAVRKALPEGSTFAAPVEALLPEYEAELKRVTSIRAERSVSSAELEKRRAELLRLRKAGYYLMKFMEAWDPGFLLDADEIYSTRYHRSSSKKAGAGRSSKAPAETPAPSPPEHDEDPVSLADLEALHTELHGEQPGEADGS